MLTLRACLHGPALPGRDKEWNFFDVLNGARLMLQQDCIISVPKFYV